MYVNLQQLSVIDSKVMPSFYKTFQTVCYIILNNITSLTLVCTTDPKNIASLTYVCTSDPKNTTILTKVGIHEMLTWFALVFSHITATFPTWVCAIGLTKQYKASDYPVI